MTLTLAQTFTAVAPGITSSFQGVGGAGPYSYSVLPGGSGGSVDAATGVYTAPAMMSSNPLTAYDTIQVADSLATTATASILVGTPLILLCDILQVGMGLPGGKVYLWDQKLFQPIDSGLYIAISVPVCHPFGNVNTFNGVRESQDQFTSVHAMVDIDIISRNGEARDRKEEVVMALLSDYSLGQQYANAFSIGRLPLRGRFTDLSFVDGAAIPYRYKISVAMQYSYTHDTPTAYYDTFIGFETVPVLSYSCIAYGMTMLTSQTRSPIVGG